MKTGLFQPANQIAYAGSEIGVQHVVSTLHRNMQFPSPVDQLDIYLLRIRGETQSNIAYRLQRLGSERGDFGGANRLARLSLRLSRVANRCRVGIGDSRCAQNRAHRLGWL